MATVDLVGPLDRCFLADHVGQGRRGEDVQPSLTFGREDRAKDEGEAGAGTGLNLPLQSGPAARRSLVVGLRLLCELASNAGRVLSRESLLERVWSYDYFGDGRLVDVPMRRSALVLDTPGIG